MQHGGVTVVYDGDGNRVSETVAGVTTNYLVDTQNPTGYAQVMEELQNGAVVRRYTWGHWLLSQTQLVNSTWQTSYYGYGSVRFLTDAAGPVTASTSASTSSIVHRPSFQQLTPFLSTSRPPSPPLFHPCTAFV